jgi:hypothetical protein
MSPVADLLTAATTTGGDPITALLARDWAALGGWSLLIGTWVTIVMGAFREWWVPGARYRRLEESSIKMTDANTELRKQNGQLITANEITRHFFEETVPKRGELRHEP